MSPSAPARICADLIPGYFRLSFHNIIFIRQLRTAESAKIRAGAEGDIRANPRPN